MLVKERNAKFFLIVLLSANNFYNPCGILSVQSGKFLFYIFSFLCFVFVCKNRIDFQRISDFPNKAYTVLLVSILFASCIAGFYQKQSYLESLIAVLPYFMAYFGLFLLFKLRLKEQDVISIITLLIILTTIVYVVNFVTFPRMFFGSGEDLSDKVSNSRGILRIRLPYMELYLLGLLYSINQWLLSKKKKWVLATAFCFIMIVLSVTRQYILWAVVLGGWFLLKHLSFLKKICLLVFFLVIYVYILPHSKIYNGLVNQSQEQVMQNKEEDDIRIRAFYFYTDVYQTNVVTRIFGNGVPSLGKSQWGKDVETVLDMTHYYGSDVGWAGFYWYFGLLSVCSIFWIFFKGVLIKKDVQHEYQTYFCLAMILLSITSAPIMIYRQIISVMLVVYLVYGCRGIKQSVK